MNFLSLYRKKRILLMKQITVSVSVLLLLSKVFENMMHEQLYEYLNNYFNDLFCGFCNAHSTQHVLPRLIQSLKKELDISRLVGTIFIVLSKAYGCLPHDLLIAKLEVYGLDEPSLNLVNDYLRFRKQRKKIISSYSDWANVTRGIPQRSILEPLIFSSMIFSYLFKNLTYANLLSITYCSLVEIISQ